MDAAAAAAVRLPLPCPPVPAASSTRRDQLLLRLATFAPARWPAGPVSALQCARRGWSLEAVEAGPRLRCAACRASVCARLPSPTRAGLYEQCVQRLQRLLVDGHAVGCRWAAAPVHAVLLRPCPAWNPAEALRQMCARAGRMVRAGVSLPLPDAAQLEVPEQLLQAIVTEHLAEQPADAERRAQIAAKYAVAGWDLASNGRHLRCSFGCRVWDPAQTPRSLAAPSRTDDCESEITTVKRGEGSATVDVDCNYGDGEKEGDECEGVKVERGETEASEADVQDAGEMDGPIGSNCSEERITTDSPIERRMKNNGQDGIEIPQDSADENESDEQTSPECTKAEHEVQDVEPSLSASQAANVHIEIDDDLGDICAAGTDHHTAEPLDIENQPNSVRRATSATPGSAGMSELDTASNQSVCGSPVNSTVMVGDVSGVVEGDADSSDSVCSQPPVIDVTANEMNEIVRRLSGCEDAMPAPDEADVSSDESVRGSVVDLSGVATPSETERRKPLSERKSYGAREHVQAAANREQGGDLRATGDDTEFNDAMEVTNETDAHNGSERSEEDIHENSESDKEVGEQPEEITSKESEEPEWDEHDEEVDLMQDEGKSEEIEAGDDMDENMEEEERTEETADVVEDEGADDTSDDEEELVDEDRKENSDHSIHLVDECSDSANSNGESENNAPEKPADDRVMIVEDDACSEGEEEPEIYSEDSVDEEGSAVLDESIHVLDAGQDCERNDEDNEESSNDDDQGDEVSDAGEQLIASEDEMDINAKHEEDVDINDGNDDADEANATIVIDDEEEEEEDRSEPSEDCDEPSFEPNFSPGNASLSSALSNSTARRETVESNASSACDGTNDSLSVASQAETAASEIDQSSLQSNRDQHEHDGDSESGSADTVEYVPLAHEHDQFSARGKRSLESDDGSAPVKRRRAVRGPLESHCSWCPWVSGVDGDPAGWQQVLEMLSRAAPAQSGGRRWGDIQALENLQHVWTTLDKWTAPIIADKRTAQA